MSDVNDNGEDEHDFLMNPDNWPDESDTHEWIKYSLKLLRAEINCVLGHMDELAAAEGEDINIANYRIAKHFENLREGIFATSQVHVRTIPFELVAELAREKLEVSMGVPFEVVDVPGIGTMFKARPVVVPDNIDGLDEQG